MTSTRGWLARRPDGLKRVTGAQKRLAKDTVREALLCLVPQDSIVRSLVEEVAETAAGAIDDYPTDRSCHTCDLLYGARCLHWDAEVPTQALEAGCDAHATDGTPF